MNNTGLQVQQEPLPNAQSPVLDEAELHKTVSLLVRPGDVTELRMLGRNDRGYDEVCSGYFSDPDKLIAEATRTHLQASGQCYITLNPVKAALLARRVDRLETKPKQTTSDGDIERRRWLLIDLDPVRPAGVSATDAEKAASCELAGRVRTSLTEEIGWPPPVLADSGNGFHLLYRIDLPNDAASTTLVKRLLSRLSEMFGTEQVHLDRTVYNAGRIVKLYGTLARKGDHTAERPHRVSRLVDVPKSLRVVPVDKLALVAGEPEPQPHETGNKAPIGSFDVARFIGNHGIEVAHDGAYAGIAGAVHRWRLNTCPFCGESDGSAVIIQFDSGRLGYRCQHNRCIGRDWRQFREHFEPGYQEEWQHNGHQLNPSAAEDAFGAAPPHGDTWPAPIPFGAHELPSFPIECLPPILATWVEQTAAATQTPPDLAAMVSLGAVAACTSGRLDCQPYRGFVEPTNLYVGVMQPPANRKSEVFRRATAPIYVHEKQLRLAAGPAVAAAASQLRCDEARLKILEKKIAAGDEGSRDEAIELAKRIATNPPVTLPALIVDDTTSAELAKLMQANDSRMASFSAEGGVFDIMAGKLGGTPDFDIYLKAHSGDVFRQNRVTRAAISMDRPLLACCYAFQPEHARNLSESEQLRGRGLLGRFLFSIPKSLMGSRSAIGPQVDEAVEANYRRTLDSILRCSPGVIELHALAVAGYEAWFNEVEGMLAEDGELSSLRDWGGKLVGATIRIAGILHAIQHAHATDPAKRPLDEDTFGNAVQIARYFIPHAKVAFALFGGEREEAHSLLDVVKRAVRGATESPVVVTRRDLHQRARRQFSDRQRLSDALSELCARNYLRAVPASSASGRPSEQYQVHPGLLSGEF
jgi:hypothetical protein